MFSTNDAKPPENWRLVIFGTGAFIRVNDWAMRPLSGFAMFNLLAANHNLSSRLESGLPLPSVLHLILDRAYGFAFDDFA